jgi:glycosidase
VPDRANGRFYPQIGHNTIFVFDPRTNESGIPVHGFNIENPAAGNPVVENAMGYLMRNAQWLVQVIGVDGLRIDAAKHVQGFVLDLLDRSVYRQNRETPRWHSSDVFTYSEVFDAIRHSPAACKEKPSTMPTKPHWRRDTPISNYTSR